MTPDDANVPDSPDGPEEKAANLLNASMVTAIGLAIGVAALGLLWSFATAFWSAGATGVQGAGWINLLNGAGFIIVGALVTRFGVRMFRSKRL